jgi:hypothetical protein
MNGMFVKNSFLQGFEIEKASKLKMYIKLVKRKRILVSGVFKMKSYSFSYLS